MAPILKLCVVFTLLLSTNELEQQLVDTGNKGGTYSFATNSHQVYDYCLFYGPPTEKPLLLWNSSSLMLPENVVTVTDLRHRLRVMLQHYGPTSLQIVNLTESDSGWYRTESWQNKSVLLAKNIHVYVCETVSYEIYTRCEGETLDVRCEGVRGNNTGVEWFHTAIGYWFLTNTDFAVFQTKLAETSTSLHIANFSIKDFGQYTCLTLDNGRCVHSHKAEVFPERVIYYRTLKDKVVFPCFTNDRRQAHWKKNDIFLITFPLQNNTEPGKMYLDKESKHYMEDGSVSGNYSLVIFSLKLSQSGVYTCINEPVGALLASHELVVCPKSLAFTKSYYEGDKVTLNCSSEIAPGSENVLWFRKTVKREGFILPVDSSPAVLPWDLKGRLNTSVADNTLVLSDLTLEDSGEYWCAILVVKICVAEAKTLLIYEPPHTDRDQLVIDSTFNPVYAAVMGSALLVMACVVVAVKVRNKRGRYTDSLNIARNTVELQGLHW